MKDKIICWDYAGDTYYTTKNDKNLIINFLNGELK